MLDEHRAPTIYSPTTIPELLRLRNQYPLALLWAGGTSLMPLQSYEVHTSTREIIQIATVTELQKIMRREKYLEVGSGVTVNGLIKGTGQNVLPPILYKGLSVMATEPLRNMITLGGSLALRRPPLHIATLLVTLGAHVEIRRKSKTQWIPIYRFLRGEGTQLLNGGDIITKVRIPLDETNMSFSQTIGNPFLNPEDSLIFCAAAYITDQSILKIRIAISFPQTGIWRWTELEKKLTLIQLPIQKTTPFIHEFQSRIRELHEVNSYQKRSAVALFKQTLFALNHH